MFLTSEHIWFSFLWQRVPESSLKPPKCLSLQLLTRFLNSRVSKSEQSFNNRHWQWVPERLLRKQNNRKASATSVVFAEKFGNVFTVSFNWNAFQTLYPDWGKHIGRWITLVQKKSMLTEKTTKQFPGDLVRVRSLLSASYTVDTLQLSWLETTATMMMMMSWCLMSSDVIWHIRDKLWPMPKHGSINLYVHGNQKAR